MKKNLAYQRRNRSQNICLVISPVLLCSLLAVLQLVINNAFKTRDNNFGCKCLEGVSWEGTTSRTRRPRVA